MNRILNEYNMNRKLDVKIKGEIKGEINWKIKSETKM